MDDVNVLTQKHGNIRVATSSDMPRISRWGPRQSCRTAQPSAVDQRGARGPVSDS